MIEGEETAPVPAETPAETLEEAPAAETPAAEEAPPEFNAAESVLVGDKSEWMKALDHELEGSSRDSFSVSAEELAGLPIEAKKLFTNLRRMADAKASAAAEAEKAFKLREIDLEKKSLELQAQGLAGLDIYQDDRLRELAKGPEGAQPDPHTPEGMKWLADKHFAEHMQNFLGRVDEVVKERTGQKKAAEAEAAITAEKAEVVSFIESVGGMAVWSEYHADVVQLKKRFPNMNIQEAYNFVRSQRGEPKEAPKEDPGAAARAASSRRKPRRGAKPSPLAGLTGQAYTSALWNLSAEEQKVEFERIKSGTSL